MTLLKIPTNPKQTNYQFSVVIDGTLFFLSIIYNNRISRYSLSILNSDKLLIVGGIPVLTNVVLTSNFKYLDIPSGDFIPLSSDNENAILNELGDKVGLYYNG